MKDLIAAILIAIVVMAIEVSGIPKVAMQINEWKNASDEWPPLDTPVWAGWFESDGRFTSGLFILADNEIRPMWWRCEDTISHEDFGWRIGHEYYPVSHWMYLPTPPDED